MSSPMFRKSALDKISSPEQLDYLMKVTTPKGWLALGALFVIIGVVIIWSLVAVIPSTLTAQGMLLPAQGLQAVTAPATGAVQRILVPGPAAVTQGQTIAKVALPTGGMVPVTAPVAGQILNLAIYKGETVARGQEIASVQPANSKLDAVIYVPVGSMGSLRPGMAVQVSPTGVNAETYGYLLGVITHVSTYPETFAEAMALFQNQEVVNQLIGSAPVAEVRVSLQPDSHTPTGYAWSSGVGPPTPLSGGAFATASIVLGGQHPISLVL